MLRRLIQFCNYLVSVIHIDFGMKAEYINEIYGGGNKGTEGRSVLTWKEAQTRRTKG